MNKLIVKYKDTDVCFLEETGNWSINPHKCFCCNNLVPNGKAVLIINNHQHIPNVLIHEECFSLWERNPEELIADIGSAYNDYKNLRAIFG